MSQQTIKQAARRTARELASKRRREAAEAERRMIDLAEQVMVAIGERDAAVAEAERRAGKALRELTEVEGLSLGEAVEWCGEAVTVREATRLRRVASEGDGADASPPATGQAAAGEEAAVLEVAGSGGAGASSAAR